MTCRCCRNVVRLLGVRLVVHMLGGGWRDLNVRCVYGGVVVVSMGRWCCRWVCGSLGR